MTQGLPENFGVTKAEQLCRLLALVRDLLWWLRFSVPLGSWGLSFLETRLRKRNGVPNNGNSFLKGYLPMVKTYCGRRMES